MNMLAGTVVSEGLAEAGGSTSKMAHSWDCWPAASAPCHIDLSLGLLECVHNMAAGFCRPSDPWEGTSWNLQCLL